MSGRTRIAAQTEHKNRHSRALLSILVAVEDEAMTETEDALVRFEGTLIEMGSARIEAGGQPKNWNRLVDRLQGIQLTLRETPEGREGITALISHEVPTVRSWAAAYALFWDEPAARAELEREAADNGLLGLAARTTLREFDAGRLTMTWTPKSR